MLTASSIGGVIWPLIVRHLLESVGFGWTWRIIGFIDLVLLSLAVWLLSAPPLEERQSPVAVTSTKDDHHGHKKRSLFYLELLKDKPYLFLVLANLCAYFGLSYILFYLPTWGASVGFSDTLQAYSVSILNATSFVGRLVLPSVLQKFGGLNTTLASMFAAAVLNLAGIAAHSPAGVLMVGAFYGIGTCSVSFSS